VVARECSDKEFRVDRRKITQGFKYIKREQSKRKLDYLVRNGTKKDKQYSNERKLNYLNKKRNLNKKYMQMELLHCLEII
jgi:hypothetical protein